MSTATWRWARIGVCPMSGFGKPTPGGVPACRSPFDYYACEVVHATGLITEWLIPTELPARTSQLDILITLGQGELAEETLTTLKQFVERGGIWIAFGGTCGADELFGVQTLLDPESHPLRLSEGYSTATKPNPILRPEWGLLHAFGGGQVQPHTAEVWARWYDLHGRETELPALTVQQVGSGRAVLFCIHFGETLLRIRMGRPVVEPALAPADIPLADNPNTLRSEDATRLDWYLDRYPCPEGDLCFLKPVADLWIESLIRAVLQAGQWSGAVVPMVWFYPRLAQGMAVLTLNTKGATPQQETSLSHMLTLTGMRAVWCLNELVHSPNFYRDLARRDHEIGLRYVPEDEMFCKPSTLQNQIDNLRRFTGVREITAVQVDELRWRGCAEFHEFAERVQILSDLTRGGYHPQASGFPFGSAHPWRPMRRSRQGELVDLYVIPLIAYRAGEWLGSAQLNALFSATKSVHGVFHITVLPSVLESQSASDTLMRLIGHVRYEGYEWATARELVRWLRGRSNLRTKLTGIPGQIQLNLLSAQTMERLGILLFTPRKGWANIGGQQVQPTEAEYFGFPCLAFETDLIEKSVREINLFEFAEQVGHSSGSRDEPPIADKKGA